METESLNTAAGYINNLLLARGLLRNGKPVDFCSLASDGDKKASKEARPTVTAQVINLVHDLILRRDRDQTHIESLASTIATLRADNSRQTTELERARERSRELSRKANLLEQSERNAQAAAASTESSARQLRDEVQKTKTVLSQVRAQANNDVRKRDIELQKLKQHLSTQQRGANPSRAPPGQSTGPQCTVIPGKTPRTQGRRRDEGSAPDLEDATYSLKQETTEFLTDLSRGLSDENDALIGLVKSTVDTLRDLMGLPHNKQAHDVAFPDSESSLANPSGWSADEMVFSPPTSYNELTRDMELVLRSLRELLTNPSFAPIEEVLTREEEIQRLRYGWEQMETRWREAVLMMNKWSTRMQNGGDSVNVAELKAGLRLGEGFRSHQQQSPSPARTLDAVEEEDEASEEEGEAGEEEGELDHESSDVFDLERLPPAESPIQASDGPAPLVPDRGVAKPEREATRLREVPGNGQMRRGVTAAKKGVRLEHTKENATSLEHEPGAASRDRGMAPGRVASTQQAVTKGYMKPTTTAKGEGHTTEARPANRVAKAAKVGSSGPKSRLPSRTGSKTQLSVQQKLDLAEKEARRASSGSSARRPSSSVMEADDRDSQAEAAPSRAEWEDEEVEDAALLVEKTRSPVKRSRISGKARRRKSTLTRQELRELMLGGSG